MFGFREDNNCSCNRSSGGSGHQAPECNCHQAPGCGSPIREEVSSMPFVENICCAIEKNEKPCKDFWVGCHLKVTLMSIPCGEASGVAMHCEKDQLIRIEQGQATVLTGGCRENMNKSFCLHQGDVICIPAGTWHNIKNTGRCTLKLSSVCAPSHR